MVTSTCTLGLWLKANVVTQGKGKVAGSRLYFVSAIFIRAVFGEECCNMAGGNVGLRAYLAWFAMILLIFSPLGCLYQLVFWILAALK